MKRPVIMSWSGGKDGAVALHELFKRDEHQVVALLTSVSEEHRRVSHHGVREQLLEQQAAAIGVPLHKVYLPSGTDRPCTNDVYERIMGAVMEDFKARGVETVAFGDLFLEDLRAYRENNLARAGMRALFPLWKRNTAELSAEVIARGFKCRLSCVDERVGAGFAGRSYDEDLLASLPSAVDPCGEYGEFHTFVHDGPIFTRPVAVRVGDIVVRDGRYYADLLPDQVALSGSDAESQMPPV